MIQTFKCDQKCGYPAIRIKRSSERKIRKQQLY